MTKSYAATSPEQLPDRARTLSMSGFDFMVAIREGRLPMAPIAGVLNYHLDEVEDGRVTFRGTPEFSALNPVGTPHGGWYGTLLDSSMACAIMTKVPKGSVYTTLEYKVNIVRAIPVGREIICEGLVEHAGRSTGVSNGTIRDVETGVLYATGSTTCLIMKVD